jgi:hypothetical protein
LALFKKLGGFEKYWRFSENQANLQNIGAFQNIHADLRNIGAFKKIRRIYKMLAPCRKTGR